MDAATATTDSEIAKASDGAKRRQARGAAAAAGPAAERPPFHISPEQTKLAEQVRNDWVVVVPAGTTAKDLDLQSEPFALIADMLHEGDNLRCLSGDKRTVIDCVCVHRAGTKAVCRVVLELKVPSLTESDSDRIPAGFEVVEAMPRDIQPGWLVRRKDGPLLNHGMHIYDREQAIRFLLDHASVRCETPQSVMRPVLS
jgi:hypothetical protein